MASKTDYATFTRHDNYQITVRRDAVAAFMPAADNGTLIWMTGAPTSDFMHVKDRPPAVAKAIHG